MPCSDGKYDKKIGPTGEYPLGGPVFPGDKGALRARMRIVKQGLVQIEFGEPITHLYLTTEHLRTYIATLQQVLKAIEKQ